MITISGLQRSFGERDLFRDATLRVGGRDRVALVGPNGSGKTTLFEMIVGRQTPDAGTIDIPRDVTLGYLAQETDALRGRSIIDEVLSAANAMTEAGHRLEILLHEIEAETDVAARDTLVAEYARLQERFAVLGGYSVESEARQILAGLGFSDADLERPTDALSGGWLMRVALAKLLLASPDVLLLDEPTNHLDLESVRWLERFLRAFDGAVLVISHDRDFMNALATRVVEIERGTLIVYTGDYAAFTLQREQRILAAEAAAANQQRRVAQIETFISRFRYKNTKAKQVQSRVKMLQKMDRVESLGEKRRAMNLAFPTPPRSGRIVMELLNVDFAYGDNPVYRDLSLSIERGQKVALVGPNGAGKTTLLKLLAGALEPQGGERKLGHNVSLGYFAQHQIESLDPANRVIEELSREMTPGAGARPRDLLGRFLFSGSDADKPVRVLSGGERTRLAMAKILVSAKNFLCLDEPTNHLDIWSRDALEDALEEYEGALVLITHDRHLIRSVADTIIEVIDGRVRVFPGDYESYLAKIEGEVAVEVAPARASGGASGGGGGAKERRRASAEERRRASAGQRTAVNRDRKAVKKVETEIERIHAEIAIMETRMAQADFYTTEHDIAGFMRGYEDARARIKTLETEWDALTADASIGPS